MQYIATSFFAFIFHIDFFYIFKRYSDFFFTFLLVRMVVTHNFKYAYRYFYILHMRICIQLQFFYIIGMY